MNRIIEEVVFGIIPGTEQDNSIDKTAGWSIEIIGIVVIAEAGIGLERDHFQEIMVVIDLEVQGTVPPLEKKGI